MFGVLRNFYLNSFLYDRKISNTQDKILKYKPSPHLFYSIIKVKTKKYNINDFSLKTIWTNKDLNQNQVNKLNNFFWLFSLDLKSSYLEVQSIINEWIEKNYKFNSKIWNFNTTSKRLISWLSNSKLTYDESSNVYKKNFNHIVQKQAHHLIKQIDKMNDNNKLIGSSAIILVGLSLNDTNSILQKGLDNLKKVIKNCLDDTSFPKSRSINQLIFFLKYLILIREWYKESQNEIPEFINEHIFNLGKSYSFFYDKIDEVPLFNGNNSFNSIDFDNYLKKLGYFFKSENCENSGYLFFNNKKTNLIMDVGPSPLKKFSEYYQAGALSFEFFYNRKKIFTNSGYYRNNRKLNEISKSTAVHNTLVINDTSSCKFKKNLKSNLEIQSGLKIFKKKIIYEKNYWKITASHDGYMKRYNLLHERDIEFYPNENKLVGLDKIIGKKITPNLKFEIRFHLNPLSKVMKTQDNKSIFIDIDSEGWKFTCNDYEINIDNGLYFGKKNIYTENQNILVSGFTSSKGNEIKWEISKL